jgi:hypothetical protein
MRRCERRIAVKNLKTEKSNEIFDVCVLVHSNVTPGGEQTPQINWQCG